MTDASLFIHITRTKYTNLKIIVCKLIFLFNNKDMDMDMGMGMGMDQRMVIGLMQLS